MNLWQVCDQHPNLTAWLVMVAAVVSIFVAWQVTLLRADWRDAKVRRAETDAAYCREVQRIINIAMGGGKR